MIRSLFKREFKVACGSLKDTLFSVAFFMFCGVLIPFALGPESETLSRYGPGLIWILVIFSISLNLNSFFLGDDTDGSLEQLLLYTKSGSLLFLIKSTVQTVILGGLFLGAMLIFCVVYGMNMEIIPWALVSLAIALPAFVFIGGTVASLTHTSNVSALVRPLILFPFYIPILIFGVGVTESVLIHQSPLPFLKILGALSLISVFFTILASGKILESSS